MTAVWYCERCDNSETYQTHIGPWCNDCGSNRKWYSDRSEVPRHTHRRNRAREASPLRFDPYRDQGQQHPYRSTRTRDELYSRPPGLPSYGDPPQEYQRYRPSYREDNNPSHSTDRFQGSNDRHHRSSHGPPPRQPYLFFDPRHEYGHSAELDRYIHEEASRRQQDVENRRQLERERHRLEGNRRKIDEKLRQRDEDRQIFEEHNRVIEEHCQRLDEDIRQREENSQRLDENYRQLDEMYHQLDENYRQLDETFQGFEEERHALERTRDDQEKAHRIYHGECRRQMQMMQTLAEITCRQIDRLSQRHEEDHRRFEEEDRRRLEEDRRLYRADRQSHEEDGRRLSRRDSRHRHEENRRFHDEEDGRRLSRRDRRRHEEDR